MLSLQNIFSSHSSSQILTIVIEEYQQHHSNQLFKAVHNYLSTKVLNTSIPRENESEEDKKFATTIYKDQEIPDVFQNVKVSWKLVFFKVGHFELRQQYANSKFELRSFELSFDKKHKEIVLNLYLPYILEPKESRKVQKLIFCSSDRCKIWQVDDTFDHSMIFNNLALDSELKKTVLDDLKMFAKAKKLYRIIGRPWKRSYLLYGPPGSGKSSLITAMANQLNYDIYELKQADWQSNYFSLKFLVKDIPNRSILVIKDIDRIIELQPENQEIIPQLLHVSDGLWSCCGQERMIIFTASEKERVNPALLRHGRIDMEIHMPYCNISTFKQLATHFLEIQYHKLFEEIEELMKDAQVTRQEVVGELMKSSDVGVSFQGLVEFLHRKKFNKLDEAESSIKFEAKEYNY